MFQHNTIGLKMAGAAAAVLFLTALPAQASGLQDLKSALTRLNANGAIKATLETKTWRRLGEGKDAEENAGQAHVLLQDGEHGLQVQLGKEILGRLDAEERSKAKEPNSKTPTLYAMREMGATEVRPMLSAASTLLRTLDKAVYKSERSDSYNGKPARVLSFEVGMDSLSERERKYVKKFDSNLDIWIAADGTPLASRLQQNAYGRIFLVISFEAKVEEQNVYGLVGDRLLTLKKESKRSASGAGERDEEKVVKLLQVQAGA